MRRRGALLAACWAAPALAGLATRPLLPIDETRYLAVAWEMWRGSWLVPHLNGQPYSDKPPLLFWLIDVGWRMLGVREWWARLVPLLLALASLLLARRLARRLWPERPAVAWCAPALLLGSVLWAVMQQLVLFDTLLTTCVLLGVAGVVEAWRAPAQRGWLLVALGIGLGVLAKGPVALLHLLPLLLLAPWWMRDGRPPRWGGWYARVLAAFLGGAAIALAWAVPAAVAGGPEYARMIFLRQTSERMVSSFAHRRPVWWYLPLLPALLLPWTLWPPMWRAFVRLRAALAEDEVRFCLAWCVPVLLGFSLISGKQVHYLLPLLPAIALLAARLLDEVAPSQRFAVLPALLPVTAAVMLLFGGRVPALLRNAAWLPDVPAWPALGLLAVGAALALVLWRASREDAVLALTASPALLLVVVALGVLPRAATAYDMRPVGTLLHSLQADGFQVAHEGRYAGQYSFAGRLEQPLVVLPHDSVGPWLAAAPLRAAITYASRSAVSTDLDSVLTLLIHPYRDRAVRVVASSPPRSARK